MASFEFSSAFSSSFWIDGTSPSSSSGLVETTPLSTPKNEQYQSVSMTTNGKLVYKSSTSNVTVVWTN